MKNNTRRAFLIKSCKIVAITTGGAIAGKNLLFPQRAEATNINFNASNYGSQQKDAQKILVAYESQFGSTAEIANVIGKELSEQGNIVQVKKMTDIISLADYDSAVIGSAIQYDKWMPEASAFVINNEEPLSKLPVAYFFCCLTLAEKTEKAISKGNKYADALYEISSKVQPKSIGQFAGVLDYSKMSTLSRIMAKVLFAILSVKEGDYRDWDAIRAWAKSLHLKLS